jgi:hypothetical protein
MLINREPDCSSDLPKELHRVEQVMLYSVKEIFITSMWESEREWKREALRGGGMEV